ncbi:potassium/proton antiporter [Oceanospirillum linum]|uniref:K+/H+ antiporter n=1 Tax=Oceanospirillum linum TaxID=966 RepID=A0A1T1HB90_OCELI|nr:potassium/proton antiporter [Oceanospirillum linum]OOV87082.1 K+/H+ antiporter [Oceanospirillum linum]SEF73890.1 potassium/proton antiporter, CPA1 family [Oleiphilus messinensis]SMP16544.1 potassium/proton antiporter, CPA1 family [Oceanospirillum linum]
MDNLNLIFLIAALLLCLSILASRISASMGMPLLFVFLGIGMLAGEDGLGGINFSDFESAYVIGHLALAIILLDGGMRTRMTTFRVGLRPALSLATLGVVVTSGLTGLLAMWLFGLSLLEGLLVGAIVGSTDAAAVFSMLGGQGVRLNERVSATLEIESGTNDPMAIFLTVTLITLLTAPDPDVWSVLLIFVKQFGIGLPFGLVGGWLFARLLKRLNLAPGLYPLLVTGAGLGLFAATNLLGGSGFIAIYLAGLIIGNSRSTHLQYILPVNDGLAWLSQIGLFLILGLLVTPHQMWAVALPATLLALGMILVARPLAVFLCLKPFFRFNIRELSFISWVGLRGAVPIVLAIFPVIAQVEQSNLYFNIAFYVVLISLLIQGSTLPLAARWLKMELPPVFEPKRRTRLGVYPDTDYELLTYRLSSEALNNVELRRLRFPSGARIAALFRNKQLVHPSGSTRLQQGDMVCIISREADLPALNKMFDEAPRICKDKIRSFFGDFTLSGDAPLKDLAALYGLTISPDQNEMTLGELMCSRFGGHPVVGDQFEWHGIRWIVVEVEGDIITKVGLKPL